MDGASMIYNLRNLLNETSGSSFLDTRTSYEFLWEAAREFVARTNSLKSTQTVTTVADTGEYSLTPDFLKLYLHDDNDNFVIKYNDGTNDYFIPYKHYDEIIVDNETTSISIPSYFTIIPDDTKDTRVSGTTTSAGAASGGEATLTDTGADFSDVEAGDYVHNTTDGSAGVVLSKTSITVLVCALFNGTDDDWTSGDAYVIQPQGRHKIKLSPPPSTSSETITLYYIKSPDPVFSDYGVYQIHRDSLPVLIKYAAWLYKYRDREMDTGDVLHQQWEKQLRRVNATQNSSTNRSRFGVSFKKR